MRAHCQRAVEAREKSLDAAVGEGALHANDGLGTRADHRSTGNALAVHKFVLPQRTEGKERFRGLTKYTQNFLNYTE